MVTCHTADMLLREHTRDELLILKWVTKPVVGAQVVSIKLLAVLVSC